MTRCDQRKQAPTVASPRRSPACGQDQQHRAKITRSTEPSQRAHSAYTSPCPPFPHGVSTIPAHRNSPTCPAQVPSKSGGLPSVFLVTKDKEMPRRRAGLQEGHNRHFVSRPGSLNSRDFLGRVGGRGAPLPYDLPEETTACREVGIACAVGWFA
nr:hypothetical protein [Kibdelosporangium sp. MJ126-NF4]